MDVRPMFVEESELYVFDMTPGGQRQWAIDNTPPGSASAAIITAELNIRQDRPGRCRIRWSWPLAVDGLGRVLPVGSVAVVTVGIADQ
jgi:hypothetical protein